MDKYRNVVQMLFLGSAVYNSYVPNLAAVAEHLAPIFSCSDTVHPVYLSAALYLLENLEGALDSQSRTKMKSLNQCIQLLQDELWT